MSIIIKLNDVAYTELSLSIDVKTSNGKMAFSLVKGYKCMVNTERNAATAWERLKNKYEPISAPSMVKLEKHFRGLPLKNGQNPEVWITELEDLCVQLEYMSSSISENQCMVHVLIISLQIMICNLPSCRRE